MKLKKLLIASVLGVSCLNVTASDCTKDQAKEAVEKMCSVITAKGKAALPEIAKFRFCGSNYVWIQDKEVKMVLHPIKRRLNGKSLTTNKDENGKVLFVEFDKAANANADGGWVDYVWAKPGAEKATPKVSYVKKCDGDSGWIAGAGIWK